MKINKTPTLQKSKGYTTFLQNQRFCFFLTYFPLLFTGILFTLIYWKRIGKPDRTSKVNGTVSHNIRVFSIVGSNTATTMKYVPPEVKKKIVNSHDENRQIVKIAIKVMMIPVCQA